jgi:hypothetical protein
MWVAALVAGLVLAVVVGATSGPARAMDLAGLAPGRGSSAATTPTTSPPPLSTPPLTTRPTVPATAAPTTRPAPAPATTVRRPASGVASTVPVRLPTGRVVGTVPSRSSPPRTVPPVTTTAIPTTTTTIAAIGSQLPAAPNTLPLRTTGTNGHVNPLFAWLSGIGLGTALLMVLARLLITRPGGRDRRPIGDRPT